MEVEDKNMGYTRYWVRTGKPISKEFINEVNDILEECKDKGITICDWNGEGNPTVTIKEIMFNGLAPYMDHETFYIDNINKHQCDFCKTARKPYDYAVKRVLEVAEEMGIVTDVSSDGETEMVTDEEYMG